jgi:hypothetical protein
VWDERALFVDDEWETTTTGPKKGWGEALASNLTWAGDAVAQKLGARKAQQSAHYLPESIQRLADPVPEQDKGELRKLAETGWTQATFAAKGLVGAATTIAGAVSQNAHRAVEHNFGKEADGVAQGRCLMIRSVLG